MFVDVNHQKTEYVLHISTFVVCASHAECCKYMEMGHRHALLPIFQNSNKPVNLF